MSRQIFNKDGYAWISTTSMIHKYEIALGVAWELCMKRPSRQAHYAQQRKYWTQLMNEALCVVRFCISFITLFILPNNYQNKEYKIDFSYKAW